MNLDSLTTLHREHKIQMAILNFLKLQIVLQSIGQSDWRYNERNILTLTKNKIIFLNYYCPHTNSSKAESAAAPKAGDNCGGGCEEATALTIGWTDTFGSGDLRPNAGPDEGLPTGIANKSG